MTCSTELMSNNDYRYIMPQYPDLFMTVTVVATVWWAGGTVGDCLPLVVHFGINTGSAQEDLC